MLKYYETVKGKNEVVTENKKIKKSSIFSWEMSRNLKTLLIWVFVVSALMVLTISLYPVLHDYLADMLASHPELTGLFDFSEMNIANYIFNQTQKTWAFVGSMFVAFLGIQIISREYKEGSAEFMYSLPDSRNKIMWQKF